MTAEEIVEEITPDDGWWKSGTKDELELAARRLMGVGVDDTVILVTLLQVVGAIREEYGE